MTQQAPSGEYTVETLLSNDSVTRRAPYHPHVSLTDVAPQRSRHTKLQTQEGALLIEIRGPEPAWAYRTLYLLNQAGGLGENWDSYGARPIRRRAIMMTIGVLNRIMQDDSPTPSVVPTVDGGVQLEWHRSGIDFEITVAGGGNVSASYAQLDGTEEWDREGPPDFELYADVVSRL